MNKLTIGLARYDYLEKRIECFYICETSQYDFVSLKNHLTSNQYKH